MSARTDIIANFLGRAWTIILSFVFLPIYLRLLGVEAYGLIGFYVALLAMLSLLDVGISLTLNRELARSSASQKSGASANLVRTLELIYWPASLLVGLLVVVLAPWIAEYWLTRDSLDLTQTIWAVRAMGLVAAFQLPIGLYQGGLFGLQRQVEVNLMLAVTSTLRVAGGALMVWWFAADIVGYFAWQALIAALTALWFVRRLWREIQHDLPPRFDSAQLSRVLPFASAVAANALVGVMLTQIDKIILSKFLSLEQFGYYTMATVAASGLWAVILPISTAIYPRLVRELERPDDAALYAKYRRYCGLMAVALLPLTALLTTYPRELVLLWTGSTMAAAETHVIIVILAIGTTLNGMTSVAALLQSAAGWPQLVLRTNACLAVVLVPLLIIMVPKLGAVGAALVWLSINCTYVVVTTPLMHRRLLLGRYGTWAIHQFAAPILAVVTAAGACKLLLPPAQTTLGALTVMAVTWLVASTAALLSLPYLREPVLVRARALLARHYPTAL